MFTASLIIYQNLFYLEAEYCIPTFLSIPSLSQEKKVRNKAIRLKIFVVEVQKKLEFSKLHQKGQELEIS